MEKIKKILKLIVILAIIILVIAFIINKINNNKKETSSSITSYESEVIKQDIINTLSSSSYIQTSLEETKTLHATYYLKEAYFKENQIIKKGTKLLKYTNGKYLKAPYNCIITESSVPSSGKVCTNKHYLKIQSIDSLLVSMSVSESKLSSVYLGQEARITIDSLDNKEYVGYVTEIGNSGSYSSSGSTFPVTVEFENDGDVMIGMSSKCSIVLEKAEDAITVANDAIEEESGYKYVNLKKENGQTEKVSIETGISNDAYTEVKSGLSEGDVVIITEEESSSSNNFNKMNRNRNMDGGHQRSGNGNNSSSQKPSQDMKENGFNK